MQECVYVVIGVASDPFSLFPQRGDVLFLGQIFYRELANPQILKGL